MEASLRALVALVLAVPALAGAQTTATFEVDEDRASELGFNPTEVEQALSGAATELLRLADVEAFMASMAEAAAIAGKGLGVDYASNPEQFVFGASVATGANASGLVVGRDPDGLPEAGFATQTSAMVGVNLGVLAGSAADDELDFWDRFVVSAHGMGFRSPFADRGFRGFMYNYGAHLTVKVVGPVEKGPLKWGGLDITSGFEHATFRLEFTGNTPFARDVQGGRARWDAQGRFVLNSSVESVPLEVSTNVQVSAISLFFGAAVDLNLGRATGDGDLSGPIVAETGGGDELLGTGLVASRASGDAEIYAIRGFGGLQVNILPLKLYAGLQGSSRASASLQAGLRVAL